MLSFPILSRSWGGDNTLNPSPQQVTQQEEVLSAVGDRLSIEEKAALNAPLSLTELQEAADAMAKNKCPGPDGIPAEFFSCMWQEVGPLLLQVLENGITSESLPEALTGGLIVLLPKKGDQRLLTNKRPITLLNVAYKIGAKAFQRRLTPILQRVISPQQFAFLPGRNIHHSLLMVGEMLHQAADSGEEHVLMKLDVTKAFDRMDWSFLLAALNKMGFGGLLTAFLRSSFATASSTVLLNGIPSRRISLARSVRQGCPLSPLLFITAFDVLGAMLQRAHDEGSIQGVAFPRVNQRALHNFFADDVYLVIRAMLTYILTVQRLLELFGNASGLFCVWEKTVAAPIPAGPPPQSLRLLPWKWESDATASPLLGVPVAQTLSCEKMETMITEKLDGKLAKMRLRHLNLAARVTVANSILLGCLWYLLSVWSGKLQFLNLLQKRIDAFVWAGRSRVARSTVLLPKNVGGLGLVGVVEQYRALTGNLFMWIVTDAIHPLRAILQGHIREASRRRWGLDDLTWVVSKCGNVQITGSAPWRNICKGWAEIKKFIIPRAPLNREEWGALSLWRPHLHHRNTLRVQCSTGPQKALRGSGFHCLRDVLDGRDTLIEWQEALRRGAPAFCEAEFGALTGNLHDIAQFVNSTSTHEMFVEDVDDPATAWKFLLSSQYLTSAWLPFMDLTTATETYRVQGGQLLKTSMNRPTGRTNLRRIVTRSPKFSQEIHRVGKWDSHCEVFTQYLWKGGTEFLQASTPFLRLLQCEESHRPHPALLKWSTSVGFALPEDLWETTWLPFCSASENMFLWQIMYRALATNAWRFPGRPDTDPVTWCTRCSRQQKGDIAHCLVQCPVSVEVWNWCESLLRWASN